MTTRREALQTLAAAGALLGLQRAMPRALAGREPDVVLRLVAAPARVALRSGEPHTRTLRYSGEVLRGRRAALQPAPGNLGPTLDLRRGEHVRIEVVNRLDAPTVIHWHGMIVPEAADGHPHQAVPPGASYTAEFTVRNPAGTYLYHPHPHGATGRQAYYGLAGLLLVREPHERDIGLPALGHELPLVLQDRRFDGEGELVFKRGMMDEMNGVLGDRVLVNGVADPGFTVEARPYRLRIANASNARVYKLAWSDDRPLRVIAADGGLLGRGEGVQELPYLTLFPFQRAEILEDFGARRDGAEIALVSRAFTGLDAMGSMMGDGMMGRMMGGGMMRGMMGARAGAPQGAQLHVARFTVSPGPRGRTTPLELPPAEPLALEGAYELRTRLAFRHMRGFLNGRRFDDRDPMAVADDERLPARRPSVWAFANDGGGMPMAHPMHVHAVQFRIVERRGGDVPADLRGGLLDAGWHDTAGVFAGEEVRIALAPALPGLFMYHCHNLEHEDGGMMRNCRFEAQT